MVAIICQQHYILFVVKGELGGDVKVSLAVAICSNPFPHCGWTESDIFLQKPH